MCVRRLHGDRCEIGFAVEKCVRRTVGIILEGCLLPIVTDSVRVSTTVACSADDVL